MESFSRRLQGRIYGAPYRVARGGACTVVLNVQNSIILSSEQENGRPLGYYKPNIWSYDHLQTLVTDYEIITHNGKEEKLKQKLVTVLHQVTDVSVKLQLIDNICKLGLTSHFNKEIVESFDIIASDLNTNLNSIKDAALCFRLLRQHGYIVSQGVLAEFLDDRGAIKDTKDQDIKEAIELYEASYLAVEDDNLLIKANALLHGGEVVNTLGLPQHWKAQWFEVRQQIDTYGMEVERNSMLLELAKMNFKRVQATHQRDLRDLSLCWKSLGLVEKMSFARNRLVESFVVAVGIAPEPHYECLRKCLTKVISFILVLDDIYDVYRSLDDLECFTNIVNRWEWEETCQLPEFMKMCFSLLSDTTNEIAREILKETGFCGALPFLQKVWADFCKSMLTEARRYNERFTPTLEEYLNTGWVSSSGPLLSMVILLFGRDEVLTVENLNVRLEDMHDLVYCTSLIIRLCNDVATTAAELKRGDSPSSILCYMREVGVTEEEARIKIKKIILTTWNKINMELLKESSTVQLNVKIQIVNTARVAHCFYHTGDGFGDQDGDIKNQIKNMLIEPCNLTS
ncbi:uncharacterized protein [Phyllobates terribilis]|uniref:uncharacterized protein n=1 Tax=Phyllobates terribilis TaxID=111132 RepID=UPI003CCB653B